MSVLYLVQVVFLCNPMETIGVGKGKGRVRDQGPLIDDVQEVKILNKKSFYRIFILVRRILENYNREEKNLLREL